MLSVLGAFVRTARMIRHLGPLGAGLPADDELLLDAPDEHLAPALVEAAAGSHERVAKVLAHTREAAEWENRDRYVQRLAAFATARTEWFDAWQCAAPRDPDLLLVKSEVAVARAFASPARAELLRDVGPLISAAAEAEPADPVPWRVALDHARGTGAPHGEFDALWRQAVRRSPHHYGCHVAALQFLSAAWYGSHSRCFAFAERAARDALPGSLLQALPVRAALACLTSGEPPRDVPRARLDAAADLAVGLSRTYAAGDPWPAEVRNLLTCVLVRLERWPDALEQLRLIGPYVTSFPWDRLVEDPLEHFLELRGTVRLEVAAALPLRGGPRGRGAHYA
jgi:hypothetical protein